MAADLLSDLPTRGAHVASAPAAAMYSAAESALSRSIETQSVGSFWVCWKIAYPGEPTKPAAVDSTVPVRQ